MKKLTVIFLCVFMLWVTLSGCRTEAAMSADDFTELCQSGTPQQVQAAIQAGADVNAKSDKGKPERT